MEHLGGIFLLLSQYRGWSHWPAAPLARNSQLGPAQLVLCQLRLCLVVSPMYPDGTRSAGALRTGVCCAPEPACAPVLLCSCRANPVAAPRPLQIVVTSPISPSGYWAENLSLQGGHRPICCAHTGRDVFATFLSWH